MLQAVYKGSSLEVVIAVLEFSWVQVAWSCLLDHVYWFVYLLGIVFQNGIPVDEDEMSLYSESNYSAASTGTPVYMETLEDNLDDLYLGTTTRRQWKVG